MTTPWLDPNETIIKQGQVLYYVGALRAFPGHMALTTKRLRIESWGNPFLGFLKGLFKSQRAKVVVDAAPAHCQIAVEKFMRAERLMVTGPDGAVARVLIDAQWKQALGLA
jgi:hypothetical protein